MGLARLVFFSLQADQKGEEKDQNDFDSFGREELKKLIE
jgi:hypothetical protein